MFFARASLVIALSTVLSITGCAAAFRSSRDTIVVDSTPTSAGVKKGDRDLGATPATLSVERKRSTELTIDKPGYETYHAIPRRHINAGWMVVDIATCAFPIALCIPLAVDALTGAWYDVDNYHATMKPGGAEPSAKTTTAQTPQPTPSGPAMSESERKATARAAFLEGAKLQESGNCPQAIGRFEAAQKLYDAPTHVLHLAQCQAATGKLVEASESYETLIRAPLTKDAPEAFRQAQEDGRREGDSLRPRIPTLRVSVKPPPSSLSKLVVKLNDATMPSEVLGIARPVNPGHYRVTVWASGYKEASAEVDVEESATRVVDLKLVK